MNWWSRYRMWGKRKPDAEPLVRIVEGGVDIVSAVDDRTVAAVRWHEVARVQTYKIDLLTTDCICLLFEFSDGRQAVQVSEEWPGFAGIFDALARAFPSIPRDWYVEVMAPAFEPKRRVLYKSERS